MRYEILGRLRVVDDEGSTSLTARKMETLLAVLLGRADQVVTTDQLIAEIWGDRPPQRVNAALHVYISQLRKFLDRPGRSASPIVTRQQGYLLHLGEDTLDVNDFQRLVNRGREAAQRGRHEEAVAHFEGALSLWRGRALNDVQDGPILYWYVTWLEEARLECVEMLNDAYLVLSRHREVVGRLYVLTGEHPLRESFYRQLMLALFRSERQADALKVYQHARERLNAELGLEPCRPLRELQGAILRGDELLKHTVA
ncbi:AfsR/SARP family transcriptional regulator [Amycolatopsis magusensis]|uniref:AfsR/SARP family transcriptional regulator n=1 Tax=Amycolatopsis magusensis TaxID=882444 RepID=UPI0037B3D21C|nr:AfsR/SARP family transcriptional regulator [Saccharothrix sp. AJ9571]